MLYYSFLKVHTELNLLGFQSTLVNLCFLMSCNYPLLLYNRQKGYLTLVLERYLCMSWFLYFFQVFIHILTAFGNIKRIVDDTEMLY